MADTEVTDQAAELVERVAAIDIAKASGMVCMRLPRPSREGRRTQEVWNVPASTIGILELGDRLVCQGVTRVVMEATGAYWKPFFFLLEARGLECWLVNAREVKNVPGRPKTDKLDAVWLAKLTERGMLRASFVPPKPVRQLRDLTRMRTVLIRERSRHKQRVEKILEDAQIKLSSVATDIWFWCSDTGATPDDADRCRQSFLRRFDLEHRWRWLVIAAYVQLRLARPLVTDLRRPWEKPAEPNRLTPARVRRGT
jgi:transposase